MRNHRIVILTALLLCVGLSAPAFAGFGAGVSAGYLHIEIADGEADTYQVGPMVDYWSDDSPWGFAAKALFSTYSFDFSEQVVVQGTPVDLFVTETDDNFRVDVDAVVRYVATDWLILLGGFRYEVQDFDSDFSLAGDPNLVALVGADPDVQAVLRNAEDSFGRGFQVYSLALAATVFTTMGENTTPFLTLTIFPFAHVESDITALQFDTNGNPAGSFKVDDVNGFGGFAIEGGLDHAITAVEGLSLGLTARYQQMMIFGDDEFRVGGLRLLDDEILISVLPYVHYSF